MPQTLFPPLPLADWRATRDTLHLYCRVLGEVRRVLAPRQKQSWHLSLRVNATGVTTTAVPGGAGSPIIFEAALDLTAHQVVIASSQGEQRRARLRGQSASAFCGQVLEALADMGVQPEFDRGPFTDEARDYDPAAVERFWQALSQTDVVLKRFRAELRGETGEVQLWPHGFDLAMLWFSGLFVPAQDPARASRADENMNFGFSTGDAGIPDAYFYATAYPIHEGFIGSPLPADALWHSEGWQGAVMMYQALVESHDPQGKLLDFCRAVHRLGAGLMEKW